MEKESGDPGQRYKAGNPVGAKGRITRTEAVHRSMNASCWLERLTLYFSDPPEHFEAARDCLRRHQAVRHTVLPIIIDAWEGNNELCWVYRAATGDRLDQYIRERKQLPLGEILPLMDDITAGLHALHEQSLHHGDLTLAGCILAGRGRIQLDSSGLAAQINSRLYACQAGQGAPAADVAPAGLDALGPASLASPPPKDAPSAGPMDDVAGWGRILGAFLTGEPDFGRLQTAGKVTDAFDLAQAHDTLKRRKIPPNFADIVRRCLQARVRSPQAFDDPRKAFMELRRAAQA